MGRALRARPDQCRQHRSDGTCGGRTISAREVAVLILGELEGLLTPKNLADARRRLERQQGTLASKLRTELGHARKEQADKEKLGRRMAELAAKEQDDALLEHLLNESRAHLKQAKVLGERVSELQAQLDRVAGDAKVAAAELPSDAEVVEVLRRLRAGAMEPSEAHVALRRILRAFLPHGVRAFYDSDDTLNLDAHWLPLHALVAIKTTAPALGDSKDGRQVTTSGCGDRI